MVQDKFLVCIPRFLQMFLAHFFLFKYESLNMENLQFFLFDLKVQELYRFSLWGRPERVSAEFSMLFFLHVKEKHVALHNFPGSLNGAWDGLNRSTKKKQRDGLNRFLHLVY